MDPAPSTARRSRPHRAGFRRPSPTSGTGRTVRATHRVAHRTQPGVPPFLTRSNGHNSEHSEPVEPLRLSEACGFGPTGSLCPGSSLGIQIFAIRAGKADYKQDQRGR